MDLDLGNKTLGFGEWEAIRAYRQNPTPHSPTHTPQHLTPHTYSLITSTYPLPLPSIPLSPFSPPSLSSPSSMTSDESLDGPKIGETLDGQTLVAVGIDFTFTEVHPAHEATFKLLDQWMSGIRLYELEDAFDLDPVLWDELLDCGYEVGEGEVEGESADKPVVTVYDVWVDAAEPEAPLRAAQARLAELKEIAADLLPVGLRAAAASHAAPLETLKLIAQLAE